MSSSNPTMPEPTVPVLKGPKKWYKRWWFIILAIVFVYLLISFIVVANSPKVAKQPGTADDNKTSEQLILKDTADDPQVGVKTAPIRIVEFADFQCPYCQQVFPVVREMMDKYKDQLYFVYRYFPLTEIHNYALVAAEAAQCAADQGKFWNMHDKLYANQDKLDPDSLKQYATEIGLDSTKFNECLTSHKFTDKITQDLIDGFNLGVVSTPTFFINGYKITGAIPQNILESIIQQAIKEAKSQ